MHPSQTHIHNSIVRNDTKLGAYEPSPPSESNQYFQSQSTSPTHPPIHSTSLHSRSHINKSNQSPPFSSSSSNQPILQFQLPPESPQEYFQINMADVKDQAKPLAPAASHSHRVLHMEEEEGKTMSTPMKQNNKHKKCIIWCGCTTALFVILAVVILVLAFTVFRVKDPELRMNSVQIQGLNLGRSIGSPLFPGANLTGIADVSVKNPNAASFRYDNATTSLYYDGRVVGEAMTPAGNARAGKTAEMNVTIRVLVDRVIAAPRLVGDLAAGSLAVSSYTKISGRVKILKMVKKHVVVRMNCTMNIDTGSQSIRDQNCKRHVSM